MLVFDDYDGKGERVGSEMQDLPMKLKIQFVAVPSAAPFVRIAMELISVGYNYDYMVNS